MNNTTSTPKFHAVGVNHPTPTAQMHPPQTDKENAKADALALFALYGPCLADWAYRHARRHVLGGDHA